MCKEKQLIESIAKRITDSRDTWIWIDYVRSLDLLSEKIFARSSHFLLELVQNAEDVGARSFNVYINKSRLKVVHDGRPFNEQDVIALCGIRTTKKPEEGTLGYLGIGFKSVYKITDSPQIYSGDFCFKFDKNMWTSLRETPWQVIPFPIDVAEMIDLSKTTFIFPLRSEKIYTEVLAEAKTLPLRLPLFLRWLKRVEIKDELSGEISFVERIDQDGISILQTHRGQERFRVFSKEFEVPPEVREDEVTISCDRSRVKKRAVLVAFLLDGEGNLVPFEAGATYGGYILSYLLEKKKQAVSS
jgi:hypothetical protein